MKWFPITYFIFSFCFLAFFSSGFVDSQDGFQYLAIARRMYYDQTFELPMEKFPDENIHMSASDGKDGKFFSPTGLGYSLALLPAVVIEDIFLRLSGTAPLTAFPLQSDWPVLLFASMTNAFFGAILLVTVYKYLLSLRVAHANAVLLSFISVVATNVFPYTKHTFAQMMFTTFLVLTFYLIRRFFLKNSVRSLFLAGVSFGLVIIAYNPTYFLVGLPLGLYYLLFFFPKFKKVDWKEKAKILLRDIIVGLLGVLPFFLLYRWFNAFRFSETASGIGGYTGNIIPKIAPAYVFVEGLWGLLFSPGKSLFLYTPLFLILIFFWFKLKPKKIIPELVSFSLLFLIYLVFFGTLLGGKDFLVWHGDSSWGPRYLVPTIPLLCILVALIFTSLTKLQKLFVFFPLTLLGVYINLIGMVLPYQIRFAGLQTDSFMNDRNFNVYEYGNEIPRYAPAFTMTKIFVKRLRDFKQIFSHGSYDLRFIDGFAYPFDLGWMKWREILPEGYVTFDNNKKAPIHKIAVQFRNHQILSTSTYSAQLTFRLNEGALQEESMLILPNTEKEIILPIDPKTLKDHDNFLAINTQFVGTASAYVAEKQVLFMQIFRINDQAQNITTLDYPYISPVSNKLFGATYRYWGKTETKPWPIWHMHSGVFEQSFDFWWLRPLHYWDLPKGFYWGLLAVDIGGIFFFGYLVLVTCKRK